MDVAANFAKLIGYGNFLGEGFERGQKLEVAFE
jgi:hypothetical protein